MLGNLTKSNLMKGVGCSIFALTLTGLAHAQDKTLSFRFNDPEAAGVEAAIAEYEAANPGVKIDFQRLKEIYAAVDVPLVFHGCTGLKNEDYQKAIGLGVKKFNVGTRLMIEFKQALQKAFESRKKTLFSCLQEGTEAISAAVKDRIMVLKSADKV